MGIHHHKSMGGCSSGEQEMNEAEQQAAAKRQKASFAASSQEEERATAMNTDLARIEKEQAAEKAAAAAAPKPAAAPPKPAAAADPPAAAELSVPSQPNKQRGVRRMSTDMTNDLLINAQKKKMELAARRKKREEEAAERARFVLKWWEEAHIKGQATKPPVYDVNAIVDMYGAGSGKNRLTMTEVQKMMKAYVKTAGEYLDAQVSNLTVPIQDAQDFASAAAAALSEAKAELSRDYEPTRDMVSIYFSQLNITVPFVSTEEIEDSKILVEKELDLVVRTATGVWTLEAGVWEGSSQHKSTAMLSSLDTPTKSGWFVDQA